MAEAWLEAVPNLSMGRSRASLDRLLADGSPSLLDVHSDPDHNRTVLTLAAPSRALIAELLEISARALASIDLRRHRGVHPRVGAIDVVPFVPFPGEPLKPAIRAARSFAKAFAARFGIPVFLYGDAADGNPLRALPALRKGGLPGLTERMAAGLAPDFGPALPSPRHGVTLVGARSVLVAFNVDLPEPDPAGAKALAKALRQKDGGLPALRALGLPLASRGRSQLSMNFVDPAITPPGRVLEQLRAEGVEIHRGELVGLVPEAVLFDAARRQLALDRDFDPDRHRLEARLWGRRIRAELEALGAELPARARRRLATLLSRAWPERPWRNRGRRV